MVIAIRFTINTCLKKSDSADSFKQEEMQITIPKIQTPVSPCRCVISSCNQPGCLFSLSPSTSAGRCGDNREALLQLEHPGLLGRYL